MEEHLFHYVKRWLSDALGITAPEYWEYQRRKAAAKGEFIFGFVICGLGVFLLLWGIFQFRLDIIALFAGAVISVSGFLMIADANEKLEKLKHIYWTKQALREYEESRQSAPRSQPTSFERKTENNIAVAPVQFELIPDGIASQEERLSNLLDRLDEKLVSGEISESVYKELKSKYSEKLKQIRAGNDNVA